MQYPNIREELLKMHRVDQDMRRRNLKDMSHWDYSVDQANTARMKEIVAEIGWPTISKVGEDGSEAAWLLVQHADHDTAFQQNCLELMKAAVGDIDKGDIAYLEDRILVGSGKPQLYGTQFDGEKNNLVPRPIQDPKNVDKRRAEMGLGTLEEGIDAMYKKYGLKRK